MILPDSRFPDPREADPEGLVAVSDALSIELLLDAYAHGIFPWSERPVRWYSPDPRAIFLPDHIRRPKKLGKAIRRHQLRVTFDTAFSDVMRACAKAHRQAGTWITEGFVHAYGQLHALGHAHSVEVWQEDRLVGGLYGVQLGGMFAGESMFHTVSNASKVAFVALADRLEDFGIRLFDAQVLNPFTLQLGAVVIRRPDFLWLLERVLYVPTPFPGPHWPSP